MDTPTNSSFISSVLVLFSLLLLNRAFAEASTFSLINQVLVQNRSSHGRSLSKLFLFGDSYLDTGNNKKFTVESWKFPFGMTLPGIPTGRYSDGLVFTDFLASFMGVESPIPYKQWTRLSKIRVGNGMNFAHGGTGVFDTWIKEPNMTTQINTFKEHIVDMECTTNATLTSPWPLLLSLVMTTHSMFMTGFRAHIAKVLDQLEVNLGEIGKTGIKKVVMLALQPLGCLPSKAVFVSFEKCDEPLNNETIFHNTLLQKIVQKLNSETTDSPFHMLDLYSAFMSFGNPLLKPCCIPTSAEYLCGNVDENGVKQYTLRENPNDNIFWDLFHAISSALKPSLVWCLITRHYSLWFHFSGYYTFGCLCRM
ncbi:hypothetical protein MKX03_028029 [Papaver bracteatum]|nr:hypothetical protein MKX03_028029 [Papaver bracteatum]